MAHSKMESIVLLSMSQVDVLTAYRVGFLVTFLHFSHSPYRLTKVDKRQARTESSRKSRLHVSHLGLSLSHQGCNRKVW